MEGKAKVSDYFILKKLVKMNVYLNETTIKELAAKFGVELSRMRALIQTSINAKNWI